MTVRQLSHEPMTASVFTVCLKTIANHILYRELMQNTTKDISFIFLFNKYSHMHASDMIMFPLYDDTGIFYLFGLPIYIYICFDEIDANKNCTPRNHPHVTMYTIDITSSFSSSSFTVCHHRWHAGLNIRLYAIIAGKHRPVV